MLLASCSIEARSALSRGLKRSRTLISVIAMVVRPVASAVAVMGQSS
jgi:hypothetical protein